ncbi:MAG: TRAP transporter substrate-binding protein DctP [Clostridiales Family XIII bacterium]|jgi:TRAP-type C4-dicarboxylate transport system substrate-binding protein|nr:TRAP transporter substrate-binding protein DctP [Clostridiales Family XIII bacterium]
MKKYARKLIWMLVVLFAAGAVLAGCGGGGEAPTQSNGDAPAENGTDASGSANSGEKINLVMALHGTEAHAYVPPIVDWAAQLNEETNGQVNIEIHYGGTLAAAPDESALVQTGGADITFSTNSLSASLFKYGGVIAAYGEDVTNTMIGAHAIMQMYKNEPAIKAEFDAAGLKCLGIITQTPSSLGGKGAKIETPSDWKGVSIQSISKNTIAIDEHFGAAPIGVSVGDLYENFSKNVCKAALIDSNLYSETRLYEEMDYLNTFNYNSSIAFLEMNLDKFNDLPADVQALMDSKFDDLSWAMAAATNDYYINFIETVLPESGVELYDFGPEMLAANETAFQTVIVEPYLKMTNDEGKFDGQKIFEEFGTYVQEGKDQYGAEYDWYKSIH